MLITMKDKARGYPGAERVRLAVHRVGFDDDVGGGIVDDVKI